MLLFRSIGPIITLTILHSKPKLMGSFVKLVLVTLKHRLKFPTTKERLHKTDSLLDDFNVEISHTDDYPELKHADEINIVMKGESIDFYWKDIDLSLPTYYVNVYGDFFEKYFMNNLTNSDNATYITGDTSVYASMIREKLSPVYLVSNKDTSGNGGLHHNFNTNTKLLVEHKSRQDIAGGSGILCTILLCSLSDRINIYGWDAYFTKQVSDMSYYECLHEIYKLARHSGPLLKLNGKKFSQIKKSFFTNRLAFNLTKIYNFHCAARLLELKTKDIRIKSYLSGALSQRKLLDKLNKIFYKD